MPAFPPTATVPLRFDRFRFDPLRGELWCDAVQVELQLLPARLLALLLAARGEVVTREQLRAKLWPGDRQVDFEVGLNTAIRKLRQALGDDAREPRVIETVRGYGYRLLCAATEDAETVAAPPPPPDTPGRSTGLQAGQPAGQRFWWAAALAPLLFALWWFNPVPPPTVTRVYPLTTSGRLDVFERPASDGTRLFYLERDGAHWNLLAARLDGSGSEALPAAPFENRYVFGVWPDRARYLVEGFDNVGGWTPLYSQPAAGGATVRLNAKPGSVALSHDGRWIASGARHGLWLSAADGTVLRQLGNWPDLHPEYPVFSPDDREIAFSLSDMVGERRTQWFIGADGANLRQLLPGWTRNPREGHGDWSADGRYFLFASNHAGPNDLWAVRWPRSWSRSWSSPAWRRSPRGPFHLTIAPLHADDATLFDNQRVYFYSDAPVAALATLQPDGTLQPFLPGLSALQPAFSPDGQWVAYTLTNSLGLWRSRLDGSDSRKLLDNSWHVGFPRWSPDGATLVMTGHHFGGPDQLWLLSRDGGVPRPLAPRQLRVHTPEWMPDGRGVVFNQPVAVSHGDSSLRFVLLPGEQIQAGPSHVMGGFPRWSPNGRYLALTADDDTNITLYDRATGQHRVLATGRSFSLTAWTADGAWIYFQEQAAPGVPLYRVRPEGGAPQLVSDLTARLQLDTHHLDFFGLTPDDRPLFALWRSNGNIYAADVNLP